MATRKHSRAAQVRGWDPVAAWYTGWVGAKGSEHHRRLVVPTAIELLQPVAGERILDVGCGPGVLAPHVAAAGSSYTGVDVSPRMVAFARRHHAAVGRFVVGDAARLDELAEVRPGVFDVAVFMMSLQDIAPLEPTLEQAARALRRGGRLVLVMTHPCFRVPRQSGWGWDSSRRLQYRRVDSYLSERAVPMKRYGTRSRDTTRSHHRPLEQYVTAMTAGGLLIEALREVPSDRGAEPGPRARAEERANREIPLLLGMRAVKP